MEQVSSFTISVRLSGAAASNFKEKLQLEEASAYFWLPSMKLFTFKRVSICHQRNRTKFDIDLSPGLLF